MTSQSTLKVLPNSLSHAVEVSISQQSEVGGVRVSDWVLAVYDRIDGIGVLIVHTVNDGQPLLVLCPERPQRRSIAPDKALLSTKIANISFISLQKHMF